MTQIEVRTGEFREEGKKLLGLDDKKLVLGMRRELRNSAKPAGERIVRAYAMVLPRRGGLADRVASRSKVSLLTDLKRGIRLQISNKDMKTGALVKGILRHPVHARADTQTRKEWTWRQQTIPTVGVGEEAFAKEADQLQRQALEIVSNAVGRAVK